MCPTLKITKNDKSLHPSAEIVNVLCTVTAFVFTQNKSVKY